MTILTILTMMAIMTILTMMTIDLRLNNGATFIFMID